MDTGTSLAACLIIPLPNGTLNLSVKRLQEKWMRLMLETTSNIIRPSQSPGLSSELTNGMEANVSTLIMYIDRKISLNDHAD